MSWKSSQNSGGRRGRCPRVHVRDKKLQLTGQQRAQVVWQKQGIETRFLVSGPGLGARGQILTPHTHTLSEGCSVQQRLFSGNCVSLLGLLYGPLL